jgi:hypothetical protein
MILVDFGSTHNYIDINFAKPLNHFVYSIKDLTITIIDGQKVKGVERCHKILVQIQELELQIGFYALLFNEMDKVLGSKWLMQLST